MYNTLKKRNIKYIYHFTDKSNIESIKNNGGLLSLRNLNENKIMNVKYGGNDWSHDADIMAGMDKYVHLCFIRNHPMEHLVSTERNLDTIWLKISIDILTIPDVKYTADISNKSGVELLDTEKALKELDIEAICEFIPFRIDGNQDRKCRAEKYEILIPEMVPLKYIVNI